MAKAKNITTRSEQELKGQLSENREALRTFRFDMSGSKLKNIKLGKALRKEIARLLTETNSRKAAAGAVSAK